jgi:hypothetical protein
MSQTYGHQRAYCSSPGYMSMDSHCGMILTGENRRTRRQTSPSATTTPTWTATNRLSHVIALAYSYSDGQQILRFYVYLFMVYLTTLPV